MNIYNQQVNQSCHDGNKEDSNKTLNEHACTSNHKLGTPPNLKPIWGTQTLHLGMLILPWGWPNRIAHMWEHNPSGSEFIGLVGVSQASRKQSAPFK